MADNRFNNNESQDQQVQPQQGEIQKEERIVEDDTLYTIERMCLYGDAIE